LILPGWSLRSSVRRSSVKIAGSLVDARPSQLTGRGHSRRARRGVATACAKA